LTHTITADTIPSMQAKTQQLQIRVSPAEKAAIKRQARAAGLDLSSYVLSRVVAAESEQFAAILRALGGTDNDRPALAELNDFLARLTPAAFGAAVGTADLTRLSPQSRNYVAAMVEHAAARLGAAPPAWCADIEPLAVPYFAAPLASLRLHLLHASPAAFKRRNIFVDSTIGARA
jgi:uncharacterized protein (DUF1778 family)